MSILVPIGLLVLGLVLIVTEVLIPSMGLLSFLAAASLVGSLASAFAIDAGTGVNFILACALLVPATLIVGMKLLPRSPLGRKMIATGLSFEPARATDTRDLTLVGHEGVVESPLRPAGTARIDGRRVDVVARGEMIESGAPVRVLEVRGNRVVVARIRPGERSEQSSGAAPVPAPESSS